MNPSPCAADKLWPRALVIFFACFISAIIAFSTWALRQRVDLVRPDYYEAEIQHQQHLDRASRALASGQPDVLLNAVLHRVEITLPAHPSQLPATQGQAHFYRPDDSRLDRRMALPLQSDGTIAYPAHDLKPGLWKVHLEWKRDGIEFASTHSLVVPATPPAMP